MKQITIDNQCSIETRGIMIRKGSKLTNLYDAAAEKIVEKFRDLPLKAYLQGYSKDMSVHTLTIQAQDFSPSVLSIELNQAKDGFFVNLNGPITFPVRDDEYNALKEDGDSHDIYLIGVRAGDGPGAGGYISRHKDFDLDKKNYDVGARLHIRLG